ncbi:oligopeptide ABC transporter permease [Salirhabdus salicampi]|uniref:oligopeptide ABC transporter permease n=1 Tax=Salirhabdus salicampi TaxID=476102 RepID=UPI0020C4285F|nr:oligopeptide ABC transporter permease [Salirhabdus salicampi]MCP8615576.1 ABC transporter permease [Salirhabdus salicampi]
MDKEKLDKDLFVPADKKENESEKIHKPSLTYWQDAFIRLRKNKGALLGIFVLLFITVMAIVGPYLNEHGLDDQNLSHSKLPPRVAMVEDVRWLGLDGTKRDTIRDATLEEAKAKGLKRFSQEDETYIDFKVKSEGNGEEDSAVVVVYYDIYADKELHDTYYWFGTDTLGRDLFTRVWLGTRVSLYIAFLAAIIDMVFGVAYGGISAYYGGRVDNAMQRVIEILVGIPNLVLVILMIIVLDPGILAITLAIALTGWIGMARIVRGQVLKLKSQEFVLAARTLGASDKRVISKHLIPNTLSMIIINTMFTMPGAIFFEAFLSFIGLGLQPPLASLGTLINDGFKAMQTNPYLMIFPTIIISAIMIAFNIVADGLRDALDPKSRD